MKTHVGQAPSIDWFEIFLHFVVLSNRPLTIMNKNGRFLVIDFEVVPCCTYIHTTYICS